MLSSPMKALNYIIFVILFYYLQAGTEFQNCFKFVTKDHCSGLRFSITIFSRNLGIRFLFCVGLISSPFVCPHSLPHTTRWRRSWRSWMTTRLPKRREIQPRDKCEGPENVPSSLLSGPVDFPAEQITFHTACLLSIKKMKTN